MKQEKNDKYHVCCKGLFYILEKKPKKDRVFAMFKFQALHIEDKRFNLNTFTISLLHHSL